MTTNDHAIEITEITTTHPNGTTTSRYGYRLTDNADGYVFVMPAKFRTASAAKGQATQHAKRGISLSAKNN